MSPVPDPTWQGQGAKEPSKLSGSLSRGLFKLAIYSYRGKPFPPRFFFKTVVKLCFTDSAFRSPLSTKLKNV